jgi:hypothetical protein
MKTQLPLRLAALLIAIIISISCRGQSLSSTSKRNKVIDSLHITDAGEQKVLALYDDCITEYLNAWKNLSANPGTATSAQSAQIEKTYQARAKELKPDIDNLRQKLVSNNAELMKFVQFSQYESQRLVVVATKYQQLLKNYGATGH